MFYRQFSHYKNLSVDLVDIIEEVTALHQQDVVHVRPRGGLVQGQPLQTNVPGQVLVQHTGACNKCEESASMASIEVQDRFEHNNSFVLAQ